MEDEKELEGVEEKFLLRCDAATCIFKTESVVAALWSPGASGEPGSGSHGRVLRKGDQGGGDLGELPEAGVLTWASGRVKKENGEY